MTDLVPFGRDNRDNCDNRHTSNEISAIRDAEQLVHIVQSAAYAASQMIGAPIRLLWDYDYCIKLIFRGGTFPVSAAHIDTIATHPILAQAYNRYEYDVLRALLDGITHMLWSIPSDLWIKAVAYAQTNTALY